MAVRRVYCTKQNKQEGRKRAKSKNTKNDREMGSIR